MGTNGYQFRTQLSSARSGGDLPVNCNQSGGFLILGESNFTTLPQGACVCIQSVSFSTLQPGDYILIAGESQAAPRRFVKLATANGITRLVVADGANQQQAISSPRLLGLISGVKHEGAPYNPNPQGFLQRAAFKLRHSFGRASATTATLV